MPEMTAIAPPSAPMMTTAPLKAPPEPVSGDIEDPDVPAALTAAMQKDQAAAAQAHAVFNDHEALLQGFCQVLQKRLGDDMSQYSTGVLKVLEHCIGTFEKHINSVVQINEHAQYSMADAVKGLQERGITVTGSPYTATVQCTTPQGYGVTLDVQKPTAPELIDELTRMTDWLQLNGYTGITPVLA